LLELPDALVEVDLGQVNLAAALGIYIGDQTAFFLLRFGFKRRPDALCCGPGLFDRPVDLPGAFFI
jgi:hypothetical protein